MKKIDLYHWLHAELEQICAPEEIRGHEDLLVNSLLGCQRYELFTQAHEAIAPSVITQIQRIVTELRRGVPIQYILGRAYFYNRAFVVNRHTLIPRRETEELCHWVLEDFAHIAGVHGLDIGTGSGCIAITLRLEAKDFRMLAGDISNEALTIAQENAKRLGAEVEFIQMDLRTYNGLGENLDFIVSNPPYIPRAERDSLPANVRDFEPQAALFVDDTDVLEPYRHLARIGSQALHPGGRLFAECHENLAQDVASLLRAQGWRNVEVRPDAQGKDRMVSGRRA